MPRTIAVTLISSEIVNSTSCYKRFNYGKFIVRKACGAGNNFEKYFNHYALIRILQAFGAYGLRGVVERKHQFIASIPKAIENIIYFIDNEIITLDLPELKKSLFMLSKSELYDSFEPFSSDLSVKINSFSYHENGYPSDEKGNGGGFVFDCRFLPNPGRYDEYKNLSGLDKTVIDYLDGYYEVEIFISDVVKMIVSAARNYCTQKHTNLQVNFGCTGGRHRSVYCLSLIHI